MGDKFDDEERTAYDAPPKGWRKERRDWLQGELLRKMDAAISREIREDKYNDE